MAAARVVIVGGGFGGLYAAKAMARLPVSITLVDRKNHHTFQPLLYQVATAALSPADIASPIRGILRRERNVEVLLGEVTAFDLPARRVLCRDFALDYDYLIVAAGVRHAYFGHEEWEPLAPGLKTLEDALEIRRRVLLAFEMAEREAATGVPLTPLNFTIVGAGPTGVELAGALSEIARKALLKNFRSIDPARARILLLEAGPRILATYPEDLARSALQQLERLGVEVRTNCKVTAVEPGGLRLGESFLPSAVNLWAAGVQASPLGAALGGEVDRAGRVRVQPDLSLPGRPEVFVIGDLAAGADEAGRPLPGVAPVAIQQGRAVAENLRREFRGQPRRPFHYIDRGNLATVGRAAAVADFGRLRLSGFLAWVTWLTVHILWLIGFRNRLLVGIQWAWSYLTYQRGIRLITGPTDLPGRGHSV